MDMLMTVDEIRHASHGRLEMIELPPDILFECSTIQSVRISQ